MESRSFCFVAHLIRWETWRRETTVGEPGFCVIFFVLEICLKNLQFGLQFNFLQFLFIPFFVCFFLFSIEKGLKLYIVLGCFGSSCPVGSWFKQFPVNHDDHVLIITTWRCWNEEMPGAFVLQMNQGHPNFEGKCRSDRCQFWTVKWNVEFEYIFESSILGSSSNLWSCFWWNFPVFRQQFGY